MPPNLKRYQESGQLHFITFSCFHRQPLLDNDRLRTQFEEILERLRQRHRFCIFGYVLMPEHVHLLLSEPEKLSLALTIGALKTEVSKLSGLDGGSFWQRRYYDFNVYSHQKFTEKLKYIHRNPVKRGLVAKPQDWPWSSYRHYFTGEAGRVEIESEWTLRTRSRATVETHP
ncbi:REP-associated tyrosine transposase [Silvibacterium acidisoli]|uniref:REP-associated tyrosine transposase n=1 Tax=Acidobacteriaceae bacterium ZG23-2 TaxID=2883246 RepID=UPI00406C64EE